jgi:hypothetical protein
MKGFKQYLSENSSGGGTLHAFDVDGTLMHTTARVHVRDQNGHRVSSLSHDEFNNHKLHPGHHYDFSEFRSSHQFHKEKPIRPMLAKLKAIHKNSQKNPKSRVIINTARSDFDDKHHFAQAWKKHGVDIHKIHVERAGNIKSDESVAAKKAQVMRKHLKTGRYTEAHFYDDDKENLRHFNKLRHEFPHIKLHAHHVHPDGSTSHYTEE